YDDIFGLEHGDAAPGMLWEDVQALENGATETLDSDDALDGSSVDYNNGEKSSANIRLNDGRTILCTRQPLVGGGWVAIYEDVTERQRAREKLVHMARHDVLTGLPNRMALREHLLRQLAQQSESGSSFGVLSLDLDEFKTINDAFGHPAGDRLLRSVAERLQACSESGELVARLGGDEFAIVTGPL